MRTPLPLRAYLVRCEILVQWPPANHLWANSLVHNCGGEWHWAVDVIHTFQNLACCLTRLRRCYPTYYICVFGLLPQRRMVGVVHASRADGSSCCCRLLYVEGSSS